MKIVIKFTDGYTFVSHKAWNTLGSLTFEKYITFLKDQGGIFISNQNTFYPYHSIESVKLE